MTLLYRQAQSASNASGTATFMFRAVEPGYTWTFSIMAVVASIPSYNFGNSTPIRGQDAFGNAVWTLYRNNIPEFSWTGYTVPKNVQAQGTENLTVQGIGLAPNTQFVVTLKGSTDVTGTVGDMTPAFDHVATPGNGPDSNQLIVGVGSAVNTASSPIVAGAPGVQLALWSLSLSISQTNASAAAGIVRTLAKVQSTSGITVAQVGVTTFAIGATACNAVDLNMNGLVLPVDDGLNVIGAANGPGGDNIVEASVIFSQV